MRPLSPRRAGALAAEPPAALVDGDRVEAVPPVALAQTPRRRAASHAPAEDRDLRPAPPWPLSMVSPRDRGADSWACPLSTSHCSFGRKPPCRGTRRSRVAAREIDPARAASAINAALLIHPLTRCAIERGRAGRPQWIDDDAAAIGPSTSSNARRPEALEELRISRVVEAVRHGPRAVDASGHRTNAATRTCWSSRSVTYSPMALACCVSCARSAARTARQFDPPPAVDVATAQAALEPSPATTLADLERANGRPGCSSRQRNCPGVRVWRRAAEHRRGASVSLSRRRISRR